MGSDWVAPVVTGVVGVAGVTATYLTGRLGRDAVATQAREQREHELHDRIRSEKVDAYLGYLEAGNEARRAALEMSRIEQTPETRPKRLKLQTNTLALLTNRRDRLRIVAPLDVREFAKASQQDLNEMLSRGFAGEDYHVDNRLEAALLASMKRDLGHELAPFDVDALTWEPRPEPAGDAGSPRTKASG